LEAGLAVDRIVAIVVAKEQVNLAEHHRSDDQVRDSPVTLSSKPDVVVFTTFHLDSEIGFVTEMIIRRKI
jgi:hypothetical protein